MALNGWPISQGTGSRPFTKRFPLATGQSFVTGNLVVLDGSGDIAECTADPAEITGWAAEPAADAVESGYVMVYVATNDTLFAMEPLTGTITEAAIGEDYAVDFTSSVWTIDLGDTANVRVLVVGVDINRNIAIVKVLQSVRTFE